MSEHQRETKELPSPMAKLLTVSLHSPAQGCCYEAGGEGSVIVVSVALASLELTM